MFLKLGGEGLKYITYYILEIKKKKKCVDKLFITYPLYILRTVKFRLKKFLGDSWDEIIEYFGKNIRPEDIKFN